MTKSEFEAILRHPRSIIYMSVGTIAPPASCQIPESSLRAADSGLPDEAGWHAVLLRNLQPHQHTVRRQQEHRTLTQHRRQYTTGIYTFFMMRLIKKLSFLLLTTKFIMIT